jgi:hypothetical protein
MSESFWATGPGGGASGAGRGGAGSGSGTVPGPAAPVPAAPVPAVVADTVALAQRAIRWSRLAAGSVRPLRPAPLGVPAVVPMTGGSDRPGGGGDSGGADGRPGRSGRAGRPGNGGGNGSRTSGGDSGRLPGPLLRHRAERNPHGVPELPFAGAAVTGTAGCSYAELDRRARAIAARLGTLLQPGSRVMLVYPQGPDLAGAFLGCLYAGMAAVPLVLASAGATESVGRAVRRCAPELVLTGTDGWSALAVDRSRTQVLEADGVRVSGEPVWRLAQQWRPVGVLRGAAAYHRYHDDGAAGGRLEPAMGHGDLSDVMGELAQAVRLGTDEENVGWIAAVHGVEDAIWRILLPIRVTS